MSEHGLTTENFLLTLPPALAADETMQALAEGLARVLAGRLEELEQAAVYPHIDRLEGPLLDILARDFKVDWWDSDWDREEKRRTLATSWQVHKTLGTKAAVEKAASAVYPNTRVLEWFQYGGEPYRFKLDVGLGEFEWDRERHRRLMRQLACYKNLRSHLEAVEYHVPPVVLENHSALFFSALLVTLAQRTKPGGVERERLVLPYGVRTGQVGRLASFILRAHGENRQGFSVGGFYRAQGHNRQRFGFQKIGAAVRAVTVQGVGASLTTSNTGWRFNGKQRFNGRKKFNGGIKRSVL